MIWYSPPPPEFRFGLVRFYIFWFRNEFWFLWIENRNPDLSAEILFQLINYIFEHECEWIWRLSSSEKRAKAKQESIPILFLWSWKQRGFWSNILYAYIYLHTLSYAIIKYTFYLTVIKSVILLLFRAKKVFHRFVERDYIMLEINIKR